jgi:hypothetical protein
VRSPSMAASLRLVAALSNVTAVIVMVVPPESRFFVSPGPDQHGQITASARPASRHFEHAHRNPK